MVSKLKHKLLKSIKSKKLNVFGLFLLLAFLFLVISKLSKEYTESVNFAIKFSNVPEHYVLTKNDSANVNVVMTSHGFNLMPLYFSDHSLKVDFEKDLSLVDDHYIWVPNTTVHNIKPQLGDKVEVVSIKPDTLKFSFQTLAVKKVPVVVDSKILFSSGYDLLNGLTVSPDSINVIAPQNVIDNIEFINTKSLTLKEVKSNINSTVNVVLPKVDYNIKLSENNVTVTGDVEKFTEGTIEVPLNINNTPNNATVNFFPKTVSVLYYLPLKNFKEIKLQDFRVECDYNEVSGSNRTFLTPKITRLPNVVKNAKIKQSKVDFILVE